MGNERRWWTAIGCAWVCIVVSLVLPGPAALIVAAAAVGIVAAVLARDALERRR